RTQEQFPELVAQHGGSSPLATHSGGTVHTIEAPLLRRWAHEQRRVDLDESLESPLLDLHRTSDVNDIEREHLALARNVFTQRTDVPPGQEPNSTNMQAPHFFTTAAAQRD